MFLIFYTRKQKKCYDNRANFVFKNAFIVYFVNRCVAMQLN